MRDQQSSSRFFHHLEHSKGCALLLHRCSSKLMSRSNGQLNYPHIIRNYTDDFLPSYSMLPRICKMIDLYPCQNQGYPNYVWPPLQTVQCTPSKKGRVMPVKLKMERTAFHGQLSVLQQYIVQFNLCLKRIQALS